MQTNFMTLIQSPLSLRLLIDHGQDEFWLEITLSYTLHHDLNFTFFVEAVEALSSNDLSFQPFDIYLS